MMDVTSQELHDMSSELVSRKANKDSLSVASRSAAGTNGGTWSGTQSSIGQSTSGNQNEAPQPRKKSNPPVNIPLLDFTKLSVPQENI